MLTMISAALAKKIVAACRRECGGKRDVEIGERAETMNFLMWQEDDDLQETHQIQGLIGSEIHSWDGWVALDCYCYFPEGHDEAGDLDDNVYLLIDANGKIVYESNVSNAGYMNDINKIIGVEIAK